MLEPWNDSSILPPPVHTCPCDNGRVGEDLKHQCNNIIKILSNQSPLHKEGAILSRFVYKFDKKFRNDIGYRYFKKVNTALRKYLALNLLKDVEHFMGVLPCEEEFYLPTRQMLEYVLVRLLTFSKIMMRICLCAKQATVFYLQRIKRGENHWMSLMPFALLCRVHSMCLVLLQHSCNWYTHLYGFLDKLQLKGLIFLPENYKLPFNLEEWLDMKNVDNIGRFEWLQKKSCDIDSVLIEDDENDTIDTILKYVDQINDDRNSEKEKDTSLLLNKLKVDTINGITPTLIDKKIDQGEVVSREMFKSFNNLIGQKNIKGDPTHIHHADNVTNKNTLESFLNLEEKFRNENNDHSLTSHLSFMQWQAMKKSLQQLLDSLANNRKIERKFKKIWKEKCLDYI